MTHLRELLDHIEKIAFSMPPPNECTPQIVNAVIIARNALPALLDALEEARGALEIAIAYPAIGIEHDSEMPITRHRMREDIKVFEKALATIEKVMK